MTKDDRIAELEDLIRSAAPLSWVHCGSRYEHDACEWEKRALALLKKEEQQ
jgi:hypothetical protein